MSANIFDRDTLLDLTVNIIPLGIIAFFLVLFLVYNPWAAESTFGFILQMHLLIIPFVGLALLTYVSAKHIEQ